MTIQECEDMDTVSTRDTTSAIGVEIDVLGTYELPPRLEVVAEGRVLLHEPNLDLSSGPSLRFGRAGQA